MLKRPAWRTGASRGGVVGAAALASDVAVAVAAVFTERAAAGVRAATGSAVAAGVALRSDCEATGANSSGGGMRSCGSARQPRSGEVTVACDRLPCKSDDEHEHEQEDAHEDEVGGGAAAASAAGGGG